VYHDQRAKRDGECNYGIKQIHISAISIRQSQVSSGHAQRTLARAASVAREPQICAVTRPPVSREHIFEIDQRDDGSRTKRMFDQLGYLIETQFEVEKSVDRNFVRSV
jgi:hypothetical protein